jgi:hypothetical protein
VKLRLATALAVLLLGGAASAGGPKGKLGVRRLSEVRSGPVVVGQVVDLAPGMARMPGRPRIGRDHHGQAMADDGSTAGQLRFRNSRADGLPVTSVRTWDGVTRRWSHVKLGARQTAPAKPAPEARPAAFIPPTTLPARGRLPRPNGDSLASVRLGTYYGRSSGKIRLTIDAFDASGRAMNFHLELPLDAVNEALELGVPVEEDGYTIAPGDDALEIARTGPSATLIRIDRRLVDQVWAEADRDFPLAD